MRSQSGISATGFQAVSGSQPVRQACQSGTKRYEKGTVRGGERDLLEERADTFPVDDKAGAFPSNRLRTPVTMSVKTVLMKIDDNDYDDDDGDDDNDSNFS